MEVRYEAVRDLHFVRLLETPECSPVRSMCDIDTLLRGIIDDAGLRLPAMDALNIPLGVDAACQTVGLPKYQDRICVARAASATRAPQLSTSHYHHLQHTPLSYAYSSPSPAADAPSMGRLSR